MTAASASPVDPNLSAIPDLLARAASFGLAGARLAPPSTALTTPMWNKLVDRVGRERQWGPLVWAIADGWWPASDAQREQALVAHRSAMATALHIEQRLLELHDQCIDRGIDIIVVKGPAVAHLDHVEPSLRSFADLDLLVRSSRLAPLERLLVERGGVRRFGEPRPGFDERFSKGFSVRLPDGVEIDIHRTLALGPFGLRIEPNELLARTTTFELGGATIIALDRRGRFLHACIHAALGAATPAMTARRDIVAICEADRDDQPLLDAISLAERWGLGLVVSWAMHDAAATFNWLPPEPVRRRLGELEPSPRDWAWLHGYRSERSSARHAFDSLQAIDAWTDRVRFAVAVLAPHNRTSVARIRRAVRELRPVRPVRTVGSARPAP